MTSSPFKGKRGLDANGFEVTNVADPTTQQSAPNLSYSETFIRLNEYDQNLTYDAGRFVVYQGRLFKANKQTGNSSFIVADWDRQTTRPFASVSSGGQLEDQDLILINNNTGTPSFTLPANPEIGVTVELIDNLFKANTNPATVVTSDGNNINGSAVGYTIQSVGDRVVFHYTGSQWIAISTLVSDTVIVSSGNYTVSEGQTVYARNTSGSSDLILTLPENAVRGTSVTVVDVRPERTRKVFLSDTTQDINGSPSDYDMVVGDHIEATYVSDSIGWVVSSKIDYVRIEWDYTETDTTVLPERKLLVNSTNGPVTVTLPNFGLKNGVSVRVVDQGRQALVNEIRVTTVTGSINGDTGDYVFSQVGEIVDFIYFDGDWKVAGPSSFERNVWTVEILNSTSSVTFPSVTSLTEIFLNGVRLIKDVDYTADINANSITLSDTLPFAPGDILTNVTDTGVGPSEATNVVRVSDTGVNTAFFRLRNDGRVERRSSEGLGLQRTVFTGTNSDIAYSLGNLYTINGAGDVILSAAGGDQTVETGKDVIAASDSGLVTAVNNTTDWQINDKVFAEDITSVNQLERVEDYYLVVVDTGSVVEARVYDNAYSLQQTVTVTASDNVFLNDDGSIWVVTATDEDLYVSGSSVSNTVNGFDSVDRGVSRELYGVLTNQVSVVDDLGNTTAVIDLTPFSVGTITDIFYSNTLLYALSTTHLSVIDTQTSEFINAIPIFDGETTVKLI